MDRFLLGIPCRRCEKEPSNASSPVASTQCGFRVLQLGASSGLPAFRGARPNPSLKRSANGSPPGPVGSAVAFSTARAWRATVGSRLAHTLGLACPPSQARHHSLRFSSARSAGQVLSRLSASTSGSGLAREAPAPHCGVQLQATLVTGHPPPISGSTGRDVSSSPVARMPCACQELHLGASSGFPSSHGARPNPSLKRSANGSPPGPVRGTGAFSSARAWCATVVSRLAHTLGVNQGQYGQRS